MTISDIIEWMNEDIEVLMNGEDKSVMEYTCDGRVADFLIHYKMQLELLEKESLKSSD